VTPAPAGDGSIPDPEREERFESRWEAAPAVVVIMALQFTIALVSRAEHWTLWLVPWWVWLIGIAPEALLLIPLVDDRLRHRLERSGRDRTAARALFAVVSLANLLLLVAVLASLISGHEHSGGQLLLKALTVWATNTITFGLWFWNLDRGGPARRLEPNPPRPDFQFPQLTDSEIAEPGWYPRLFDYMYISFTNSIAFSPTDTLPLTRAAKLSMLTESVVSSLTLLLIAARAVNIFA
jgi:uncharacterized membrane protein